MRRTALLVIAVLALAGCSGSDEKDTPEQTPEQVLAQAKQVLDDTSGVRFSITSEDVPEGQTALTGAEGVLTHAPAFEGKITVRILGAEPEVPIVAVDGHVYAQLPFTTSWQDIDPADYGAPDPAALMDPDHGLSTLLTATTEASLGDTVRGGADNDELLTTYAGTLAATDAAVLVPTVTGDVAVSYTLTDDHELREAVLKGDFYGTGEEETYTVTVSDYGTEKEITKP
ncbi:LppX_LprAFG lipoprotein [Nocardioides sp.]|uniref:LppX_LprAFG lipoprotein n=1 Tax=Nocardioides sp. TaxID=35761 RepID=UPI0039E32B1B